MSGRSHVTTSEKEINHALHFLFIVRSVRKVIEKKSREPVAPMVTHFSHATDLQQIYYAHNVIVGR